MENKTNKKRFAALCSMVVMVTLAIIVIGIYQTGVIKGINPIADEKRDALIVEQCMNNSVEGIFYDRKGTALTQAGEVGENATLNYPTEYSYIIGSKNSNGTRSGLRQSFGDYLYDIGTGHDGIGADITLTIDNGLQTFATALLKGHVGSINVIDADTGEILCLASRGDGEVDYNVNEYSKNYSTQSLIKDFFMNRSILASHPPGSTIKVLTTIAIIENNIEDTYVIENPYYSPSGKPITNGFKTYKCGKDANNQEALSESINTYFATRAVLAGSKTMQEIAERFFIGDSIELDFTTLTSNYDVSGEDPIYELASTWYGQGKTQISPLHLTMIMGSIINENRDMPKAHLISKIENEGEVVYEGKSEILRKEVISASTKSKLVEFLENTAVEEYELIKKNKRHKCTIIAKTGTCEIENKERNHLYLVAGYSYGGKNYAISIDWAREPRGSIARSLYETGRKLIAYLESAKP